jgi:hypothetical protein
MIDFRPLACVFVAAASLVFAPSSFAQAGSGWRAGQHLNAQQQQALGELRRIDIDGRVYRVLRTGAAANGLPITTVINRSGMVGQTYHEVVIAEQPTATVRQQAGALLAGAEVTHYDQTNITLARFASLAQAAAALPQLRAALPGAEVGLPITFERPRLR